jgi:hypothetical protein
MGIMSLGLTKPGLSTTLRHPKTGAPIRPLGILPSGKVVWPVLGASSDDVDDPKYGEDGDDESSDDDEEDEEEPIKKSVKGKSKKDEDTDKDEEDDEEPKTRPERQAARYRVRAREAEAREKELQERLRKIEDNGKPSDEILKRDFDEAKSKLENLTSTNKNLTAQLAFFKSNTIDWADASDAFALAKTEGLFDDVIDEDGNVDTRELRRTLRDLAKRKPHLVKKAASGRDTDEDGPDTQSGSSMNGRRKGDRKQGADRTSLAKRFPVLGN